MSERKVRIYDKELTSYWISIWWRRRELNPRPQILYSWVYNA